MSIKDILQLSTLDRLDTELLLAFVLHVDRSYIKAYPEFEVGKKETKQFFRLMSLRKAHVPLAYILGYKQFFGHTFFVNKYTLVPRPETEVLVELVIQDIETHTTATLIDIGTGTGCIPISCYTASTESELTMFATDTSRRALRIARKNAKQYQVPITFKQGNLLEPILAITPKVPFSNPLFITANLPYITTEQHQSEKSISKEPVSALVAADDGLSLYKELLVQLTECITTNAHSGITLYFEIDPSQTAAIQRIIHHYLSEATIRIQKDLAGHDRVVRVCIEHT